MIGIALTLPFTGTPPPKSVSIATGPAGGLYAEVGQYLRGELEQAGIEAELIETAGSRENLAALESGEVDIAFLQSGLASDEEHPDLQGLARLYYEPLWIFVHGDRAPERLSELAQGVIEIGSEGSGTRAVAAKLLGANGVRTAGDGGAATLRGSGPEDAVAALLAGEADALFLVTSPTSELVRTLFEAARAGDVAAVSLDRAYAYARHFPFLEAHVLTPGMINIEGELPSEPIEIVAATAGLFARQELHAAVVPLLLEALGRRFSDRALFEEAGEFPSPEQLDFAAGPAALSYYRSGRSFLYRVLPFQVAAVLDRLKILLLPLVTLLIPLFKLAPPVYRWRIRSRIFRWYQTIMRIETDLRAKSDPEREREARTALAELDAELRDVKVPLSYAEELYNLRMHLRLVKQDLSEDTERDTL